MKGIREMYIEDFIRHPKMKELFDDNDMVFFHFLFLNSGINLRNNIAHSFFRPQDYTFQNAVLLIIALLRVSKSIAYLSITACLSPLKFDFIKAAIILKLPTLIPPAQEPEAPPIYIKITIIKRDSLDIKPIFIVLKPAVLDVTD